MTPRGELYLLASYVKQDVTKGRERLSGICAVDAKYLCAAVNESECPGSLDRCQFARRMS